MSEELEITALLITGGYALLQLIKTMSNVLLKWLNKRLDVSIQGEIKRQDVDEKENEMSMELRQYFTNVAKSNIDSMRVDLDKRSEENRILQEKNSELERKNIEFSSQIDSLTSRIESLESRSHQENQDSESLRTQMKELTVKYQESEVTIAQLKERIESFGLLLNNEREVSKLLEQQLHNALMTIDVEKEKSSILSAENKRLKGILRDNNIDY